MSIHTATDSSKDERSEFELEGRRELRVPDNKVFLVAMRPGGHTRSHPEHEG